MAPDEIDELALISISKLQRASFELRSHDEPEQPKKPEAEPHARLSKEN